MFSLFSSNYYSKIESSFLKSSYNTLSINAIEKINIFINLLLPHIDLFVVMTDNHELVPINKAPGLKNPTQRGVIIGFASDLLIHSSLSMLLFTVVMDNLHGTSNVHYLSIFLYPIKICEFSQ